MSRRQFHAGRELYSFHKQNQQGAKNTIARAKHHDSEQRGFGDPRESPVQAHQPGKPICQLSVRVGDIKGIAPPQVADSLLVHLNDQVGQCKAGCGSFLQIGI